MKIKIDVEKCIGAGLCVVAAPKVFSQNEDDGLVIVLDGSPGSDEHDHVHEAARLCPARVIVLED